MVATNPNERRYYGYQTNVGFAKKSPCGGCSTTDSELASKVQRNTNLNAEQETKLSEIKSVNDEQTTLIQNIQNKLDNDLTLSGTIENDDTLVIKATI